VQIDAFPNVPFEGSVVELYPSGSAASRNFTARISIAKGSSHIKPGMFARGMIVTGTAHNTLLIPKDAIDERKGTQSVFTLSTDKTVKRHIVEVIRENQNYVEIRMPTDLKVRDTVITQGRQNLQEGTKVQITGRQ
jgi:membrane fusion protein (multidrug efflux system)